MDNYYFGVIVTSHTQAFIPSQQLPFGAGKTTFMMNLSAMMNSPNFINIVTSEEASEWTPSEEEWNLVFENMVYNPVDLWKMMQPGSKRKKFVGWDGVAYTAPRIKGVPRFLVKLRGELTESRPEIAVLGMTASNRNDIAAPLRSLPSFEIIIPRRGIFEVQRTLHFKKFKDPEQDLGKLDYIEHGSFPRLPEHIEVRYEKWRVDQKLRVKSAEYRKELKDLIRAAETGMSEAEGEKEEKPRKKEPEEKPKTKEVRTVPTMEEFCRRARTEYNVKFSEYQLRALYRLSQGQQSSSTSA